MPMLANKYLLASKGISLIEIVISLLISSLLVAAMIAVFINIKQTYRVQDNISRIQDSGSLALEFMGRDIRMLGYWGCLKANTGDLYGDNNQLIIKAAYEVVTPITNCGATVNKSAGYYLDKTSTVVYTLVNNVLRRNTNNLNNDIVEGVEAMVFSYGVDTDADNSPNVYLSSSLVEDFEKVVSIKVQLLLSSMEDNLLFNSTAFTFNGLTKTDKRIRRIYAVTYMLRNRHI